MMSILYFFTVLIIISGSLYPAFALDASQTCDTSIIPHRWPSSHIYITDTNGSMPYIPLTDHAAIFHDDDVWNTSTYPRTVQVTLTIRYQYDAGLQVFNQTQSLQMQACSGPESVKWRFVPTQVDNYIATVSDDRGKVDMGFNSMLDATKSKTVSSPLEQLRFGVNSHNVICRQDLQLVIKTEDGSPACVKSTTSIILIERGWAKISANNETFITLGKGQREGPLLVQKISPDYVQGLDYREYPLATNVGYPITLHIGDSASNGCTVVLVLVKIDNDTATFLKTEYQNRPCPICLSENTLIDTPHGPVSVKKLTAGMTIFTQDGFGQKQAVPILKTGKTLVPPDHRMVHMVLSDKRELYVSPNHPTADGRLFGELMIGNILDGSQITSVEQVPYNGTFTYDVLPNGSTGFYWANGILVASTLK